MKINRKKVVPWLCREGFVRVPGSNGGGHITYRRADGAFAVVIGHGRVELSQSSAMILVRSLERAGYTRAQLRRELGGES